MFARCYGLDTIGLRYFNVFGPRQDPNGAYAAVIPRWIAAMLDGHAVQINGDGETSRDFCYVDNVVQANLLAAVARRDTPGAEVYNVAVGERTTLNRLHVLLAAEVASCRPGTDVPPPRHAAFRAGDVQHSLASIGKAARDLGYAPTHRIGDGLATTVAWHCDRADPSQ